MCKFFIIKGAIDFVFPNATRQLCSLHMKKNFDAYIDKQEMPNILKKHLKKLTFGETGLINSKDEKEFHASLTKIGDIQISKNHQRHVQNVTDKLYKYVLTPRWQKGSSENYTNNNAESQNHVLKSFSGWSSSQSSELVDKLKTLVTIQYKDMEKSLYGSGNFEVIGYDAAKTRWQKFSEKEKSDIYLSFLMGKIGKKISKSKRIQVNEKLLKTARKPNSRKRVRATKTRRLKFFH